MALRKKKIILIVDDETEARQVLCAYLQRKGFITQEAGHGKEALAAIEAQRPDLLILDLLMPVMDGFEVLRFLKASQNYKDIPVIMLTIKSDPQHLRKGISLQADFYLPKPFKLDNLMKFVKLLTKD